MSTLTTDLKLLGEVKAPAGFAERLLAHVGMSDSYARFDTVLGAVYVAWNRQGISAAARDASADEFEARFHKEVGRQLVEAVPPPDLAAKIHDELEGRHRLRFALPGLTPFHQPLLPNTKQIPRSRCRPSSSS